MGGELTWDDLWEAMDDLKQMAQSLLSREGEAQSIQTTALVQTALRRQGPRAWD